MVLRTMYTISNQHAKHVKDDVFNLFVLFKQIKLTIILIRICFGFPVEEINILLTGVPGVPLDVFFVSIALVNHLALKLNYQT